MSTILAPTQRRFPIGCEFSEGSAHFRVWAPAAHRMTLVIERSGTEETPMTPEQGGYFSCFAKVRPGDRYGFRLDDDASVLPDPASRFQPEGPFGLSQVVDPRFPWTDSEWKGAKLAGQIFYELHVGTFTPQGTWAAAQERIPELARVGISAIEVMPVADFSGQFGWGYDGVNLFAPTRLYGTPEDFKRFVDTAHANSVAVILDVVYNHFGPVGNFQPRFAKEYFHSSETTDWGEAINYDGPDAGPVREFFTTNAAYWIDEYHLDGLRLDATQDIHDRSDRHILFDIGEAVRKSAASRHAIVVAENEPQHARLVRTRERGGYQLDGLWNDDFHHSARVALTGRSEAYYTDYSGKAQELLSAVKYGYLFQGQHYGWQKKRRGQPALDVNLRSFVTYLQNHDQIANSAHGLRLNQLTGPGRFRAMTMLLLLGPGTPLLFQGQEFGASSPFIFFADHGEDLAPAIGQGRSEFLSQFRSIATESAKASLANPSARETFERCKLDWTERDRNAAVLRFHEELIRLRRTDPTIRDADRGSIDGAVLNNRALVLRFFGVQNADRLLLLNLGTDLEPRSISEPLIAPPEGCVWKVLVSSEDVRYGGGGAYEPCQEGHWRIPGEAAVLLKATPIQTT